VTPRHAVARAALSLEPPRLTALLTSRRSPSASRCCSACRSCARGQGQLRQHGLRRRPDRRRALRAAEPAAVLGVPHRRRDRRTSAGTYQRIAGGTRRGVDDPALARRLAPRLPRARHEHRLLRALPLRGRARCGSPRASRSTTSTTPCSAPRSRASSATRLGIEIVIAHGIGAVSFANHDDKPFASPASWRAPARRSTAPCTSASRRSKRSTWTGRRGADPRRQRVERRRARAIDLTPKSITAFMVGHGEPGRRCSRCSVRSTSTGSSR
jgi:hypothetical protein